VLIDEIARLTKDNAELRRQVSESGGSERIYKGLSFDEMYNLLASETLEIHSVRDLWGDLIRVANALGRQGTTDVSVLDAFWWLGERLSEGIRVERGKTRFALCEKIRRFGLAEWERPTPAILRCKLTEDGRMFYLRMKVKYGTAESQRETDKLED
jgi:hypothetical protein